MRTILLIVWIFSFVGILATIGLIIYRKVKKKSTYNLSKIIIGFVCAFFIVTALDFYIDAKDKSQKEFLEKSKEDDLLKQADETIKKLDEIGKAEVSYDTGITYEQLARNPKDYMYHIVKFNGKVAKVIEDDKETYIQLAVNGDSNIILLGSYDSNISDVRILKNDNVTIEGFSIGIQSYTSTLGEEINIPGVSIDKIKLNN